MKNRKKEIIMIAIFLMIQTILYIYVGTKKSYLHIDEAYSFGLSNYPRIDIQDNEDFFNHWHPKEYYEDYLSIQENEQGYYKPVYENQKNDVHPPLYYLLLRFFMGFTKGQFSKWSGIILNIIIYGFITIFMYLILKELLQGDKNSDGKASILAFMSSIILASLSNVIYIRMYALSALNILITTFLHIKLLKSEKINIKLLITLGITVLAGILTHYYYLFYLSILFIIFFIKYNKEKNIKELIYYTLTIMIAGISSLIIFPYSIQHMFFGYRGQGVINKLKNPHEIIPSILAQINNLNYYVFNNLMIFIAILLMGIIICNKIKKKEILKNQKQTKEILKIIYIPTIFFFIMATLSSPWNVLRYIVPVCGLIFILVIYYLYKLLQTSFNEKIGNIIISILFIMILISPIVFKMEPELLYSDRKEFVQKLSEEINLPTIYFFNTKNGVFIDDILIFSKIDNSYIAKDIEYNQNNINEIVKDQDISKGIIVFINEKEENNNIINQIKKYLNFTESEYLQRLNSCEVYYIY